MVAYNQLRWVTHLVNLTLAAAYLIGSGVDKDLSQAKRWLQLAIDSTYERYSRSAKVLYAAHELDKVSDEPMDIYYKMPTFLLDD